MPDIAIVTSIYGGYDELKPAFPQDTDCEWVLVTDGEDIPADSRGWRVVFEPQPGTDPCRAAKKAKTQPWLYTDAEASVWIDGSCRVYSEAFAREAVALADPVAQFIHPDRDCIYTEAAISARLPRYRDEPVLAQAGHYRHRGHPYRWGMWAATVIARRHTPEVRAWGQEWAAEIFAWSVQDQISQPYVLRNADMRPTVLPGYYRDNQWLRIEASRKHQ